MRNRKILKITPEVFEGFAKVGIIKVKKSPIPENAKYLSTHYDYETDSFWVAFEHPSFDAIPDGEKLPTFDPNEFEFERLG